MLVYIATVRAIIVSRVNSVSKRSRAASPIRRRSAASPANRCSAALSARLSPGGTVRPVTPSTFTHGTPVGSRVLITGFARAIASSCTSPNASARVTDGSTNMSQAPYHAATVSSSAAPRKKVRDSTPSDVDNASSDGAQRAVTDDHRGHFGVRRARAAGTPRLCRARAVRRRAQSARPTGARTAAHRRVPLRRRRAMNVETERDDLAAAGMLAQRLGVLRQRRRRHDDARRPAERRRSETARRTACSATAV